MFTHGVSSFSYQYLQQQWAHQGSPQHWVIAEQRQILHQSLIRSHQI